jgi:hypothetical protein
MTIEHVEDRAHFEELIADSTRAFLWVADGAAAAAVETVAQITLKHEIEDLLTRYTNRYDAKELDGILDCFVADPLLVAPVGRRFDGGMALKSFYAPSVLLERFVMHRVLETIVWPTEDGASAWFATYFSSYSIQTLQNAWSQNGRYFGRAVKQGTAWRLSEFSIVIDYTKTFVAAPVQS